MGEKQGKIANMLYFALFFFTRYYSDGDSLRKSDTYPPWWASEGKNVTPRGEPCAAAASLGGASSCTTLASRCSRTWAVGQWQWHRRLGRRFGGRLQAGTAAPKRLWPCMPLSTPLSGRAWRRPRGSFYLPIHAYLSGA